MKKTTAIALVGLLTACAAQQETARNVRESAETADRPDPQTLEAIRLSARNVALAPPAPQDSDIVCERVTPTGSLIPQRRCLTREAQRQETEQAQEWLRSDGSQGAITEIR